MSFLVSMLLPFAVCFVLIGSTSAVWWRSLHSPWLFFVVGLLALLGVHRILQVATEVAKLFRGGGHFLEARTTAATVQLVQDSLNREALATSVALLVLGFPLLHWLKRALPVL